jgi:hypothetical protein
MSMCSAFPRPRSASSRRGLLLCGLALFAVIFMVLAPRALANAPSGGAFSTVNENADGTGHCQNGNPNVNCNIYDGKQYVWMTGGPSSAALSDGKYFFAVLDPGGQNADPNDGGTKNLSSPNDDYTNRTFSITGGTIAYSGSHDFDSNKIRLMPYDDTSNPGGVYILAICSLGKDGEGYPVNPSDCKYDAFKVQATPTPQASDLVITKDAAGADTNTFAWQIQKNVDQKKITNADGSAKFNYTVSVSHDGGTISGVTVKGTIEVDNPNEDSSHNILPVDISGVSDQLSDGTTCNVTNGGPQTLTEAKTYFDYTCSLSALPQGELDNTARVSYDTQFLSNGALLNANDMPFTFTNISFAENKVDDCVDVTDTLGGSLGTACSTDPSPTDYTYSHDVQGTSGTCVNQDNTATFTTNTTGTTGSDNKEVQYCLPADLTVAKTAAPAFTRTYGWSIKKTVDKTNVDQTSGSVTLNYNVAASQTGFTDNGWKVEGDITVANPNDFEAITADVSDAIDNGGDCAVAGGNQVTVAKSSSVKLHYVCTYSSAPSPSSGTNTAIATWDASALTPDTSAVGTATAAFGAPTSTINKSITVTDTYNNGTPTTLGTLTATDASPFTSHTYPLSRTVTVTPNNCVTYPNVATIPETGQQSSVSSTVCGPVTGGLTIGFWQNKNGQGIITAGASTSGVCNSATWLRGYAPFQDLSATANCSAVATYVTNVIKAANASGSAMNAMLKAQMLATSLDVYFSTPALGGNKIGAPSPLGAVKVNLTKICHMIDGSGGTASCSGTAENVSGAFGGATALTISDMLTYAASQSNTGGSTWYAQNKPTQGLAKDAFDAINNGVAFAAP